jgi:hypothetical protein
MHTFYGVPKRNIFPNTLSQETNTKSTLTGATTMSKPTLSPDATYLELSMPGEFQRFYQEYIELPEIKLQRITLGGTDQFYFTCGEIHDRSN